MEGFEVGGVGPSWTLISVVYAPPSPGGTNSLGPSYVNYTNTTALGTGTTLSSSFQDSSTFTVSGGILGISSSLGSGFTQTDDSTTALAIHQSTSLSDEYPGLEPANTVGLNHDNDIILVWLNPAVNCTAEDAWDVLPIPAAV